MQQFLPVNKKEMKQRGWEQVDFAYITGDAYVDHPSFGTAIISRLLESRGIQSRDHQPAGLEKERKHPGFWRTAPRLSGFCRKYGFHGQSLHGVKETQTDRIPILRVDRWVCVRTVPWSSTAT